MIIRKVTLTDLNALVAVEQAVYGPSGFNIYYFRQMIELYPSLLWVCDDGDGHLAGYALGALGQQREKGWVLSVAVDEAFRGRGLASKLTEKLLDGFVDLGCNSAWLTVSEENMAAMTVYRKLGFDDFARKPDYFGPGQDRLIMVKKKTEKFTNATI